MSIEKEEENAMLAEKAFEANDFVPVSFWTGLRKAAASEYRLTYKITHEGIGQCVR